MLSLLQTFVDGQNAEGLQGASTATFSPDGLNVYVGARLDRSIAIFRRNPADNSLTFVRSIVHSLGLQGTMGIAASSDGRAVVATGVAQSTLLYFRRDVANDDLILTDTEYDGLGDNRNMVGPNGVAFSSDQEWVYVASHDSNSVTVFRRDANLHRLTYEGVQVGVPLLFGPTSLAVSGQYLFAAGWQSMVMFRHDPPPAGLVWVASLELPHNCRATSIASVPAGHPRLPANLLWVACSLTSTVERVFWSPTGLSAGRPIELGPPGTFPFGIWGLSQTAGPLFLIGPHYTRLLVFDRSGDDFALVDEIDSEEIPELEGGWAVAALPSGDALWVGSHGSGALLSFQYGLFADGFETGTTAAWSSTVGD